VKSRERYRVSVDTVLIDITDPSNKDLQFFHDRTLLRNYFINFRQDIPLYSDPIINKVIKQSNITLLIFFFRNYSDVFRLSETIFRLNVKVGVCVCVCTLLCSIYTQTHTLCLSLMFSLKMASKNRNMSL